MGIDFAQFRLLTDLSRRYRPTGRSVMLGRQRLRVRSHHRPRVNKLLQQAGSAARWRDLLQEDGFAETALRTLGFGTVEAMDLSDYEGAGIVHDLNDPLPQGLEGQFDFIYDGGTLEHVFNVPHALLSIHRMLRPGGRFVSVNGLNGWAGHGFYQFGPELAYSFWRRGCGCIIHRCLGVARDEDREDIALADASDYGTRLRLRGKLPATRVYLYYEVEKTPDSTYDGRALQSDYQARWAAGGRSGSEGTPERAEQ